MTFSTNVFYDEYLGMLLPSGSEDRGVVGVGSILHAILPSCQDMKTIALHDYSWVAKVRNTSEA